DVSSDFLRTNITNRQIAGAVQSDQQQDESVAQKNAGDGEGERQDCENPSGAPRAVHRSGGYVQIYCAHYQLHNGQSMIKALRLQSAAAEQEVTTDRSQ